MGRPRKPAEELKLAGTDKKHGKKPDINWAEEYGGDFMLSEPVPPPRRYRKETKDAWRKIMALEIDRGILAYVDLPLFGIMFDNLDMYYILSESIDTHIREMIKAGKNPESAAQAMKEANKMRNAHADTFSAIASKFIITPSDRRKLGLEVERKEDSELMRILRDEI